MASSYSSPHCETCRCRNDSPRALPPVYFSTKDKPDQIAEIDAEIRRIYDSGIAALREQCAPLCRKRNELIPAVNLPAEVLAMIFEFACPSDFPGGFATVIDVDFWSCPEHHDHPLTPATPLMLSRVCSIWRDVALGASQLWNNIKLKVNRKYASKQAVFLHYWLSKSGHRPLIVGLMEDEDEVMGFNAIGMPTEAIDVLVTYAHRIHTFELLSTFSWVPAFRQIADRASLLTCLTVKIPFVSAAFGSLDCFAKAPQLREVSLSWYSISQVRLPYAQIERLVTDRLEEDDAIDSLRLCHNLRYYKFQRYVPAGMQAPAPALTHNMLETLELIVSGETDCNAILHPLTSPALRNFVLRFNDKATALIPLLLPFFTRSACALETLHIYGLTAPEDDLISCLRALPGLRDLLLRNPQHGEISQRILDLMNPRKQVERCGGVETNGGGRGHTQCLVPKLETFYYEGAMNFQPHVLLSFLADRWDTQYDIAGPVEEESSELKVPITRLRSATFRTKQMDFDDNDVAVCDRLRDEGMEVNILEFYSSEFY